MTLLQFYTLLFVLIISLKAQDFSTGNDCGCTDVPPGEQHTCQQQKEWGKCLRKWLIDGDYCAMTCGRCQCFGSQQCLDVPANKHYSCEQQKEWGKCWQQWMIDGGYCDTTCERCQPAQQPVVVVQSTSGARNIQEEDDTPIQDEVVEPILETPPLLAFPPQLEIDLPNITQTTPEQIPEDISNILFEELPDEMPTIETIETPSPNPSPTPAPQPPRTSPTLSQMTIPTPIIVGIQPPEQSPTVAPTVRQESTPTMVPMPPSPQPAICDCTDVPPGRSLTCTQQKALGKCMRGWMLSGNHCEITCGRCRCLPDANGDKIVKCTDIPPSKDHSCEDQKRYGKCMEKWMIDNGYCNYTCQRCEGTGLTIQPQFDIFAAQVDPPSSPILTPSPFMPSSMLAQIPEDELSGEVISFAGPVEGIPAPTPTPTPTPTFVATPTPSQATPSTPSLLPASALSSAIQEDISQQEGNPSPQETQQSSPELSTIPSQSNPISLLQEDEDYIPQYMAPDANSQIQYRQYTDQCGGDIMREIELRPYLSILNQLLVRSGLVDTITDRIGGVTLFAPQDSAFREFVRNEEITLQDLFVNPTYSEGVIPKLLAYHVVPRKLSARSLAVGLASVSDTMLAGKENLIFVKSTDPLIMEGRASEVEVIEQDLIACDGVIHVIDGLLLPVSDVQSLAEDPMVQMAPEVLDPRTLASPAPNFFMTIPTGVPAPQNLETVGQSPIPIPTVDPSQQFINGSQFTPVPIPSSNSSQFAPVPVPGSNLPSQIPVPTIDVLSPSAIILESREPQMAQAQPIEVNSTQQPNTQCRNVSVLDILENLPNTEILFRMIQEFELQAILAPPMTLFAPVDEALEQLALKLGFKTLDELFMQENRNTLLSILFFHMIPQEVELKTVDPNVPIPNINNSLLYFSTEDAMGDVVITIQEIGSSAKILEVDPQINNGCGLSVYMVDTALLPFTIIQTDFPDMEGEPLFAPPPPPKPLVIPEQVLQTAPDGILDGLVPQDIIEQSRNGTFSGAYVVNSTSKDTGLTDEASVRSAAPAPVGECISLLQILKQRQDLTLMNALIQHAGLAALLEREDAEYTLLAPNDKAFQELVMKLGPRSQSLTNQEVLANILGYHIIRDVFVLDDMEVGLELPTLVAWLGNSLSLLVEENGMGIMDAGGDQEVLLVGIGSEAMLLETDIEACDSVLHIIDTVLLPVDTQ